MRGRKLVSHVSLIMFCILMVSTPLVLAAHPQTERIMILMLSTEALTPALVLGLVLIIRLNRPVHKA